MTGRTESLPREKFEVYRERAEGLRKSMENSLKNLEYHGAMLSAIHAAISAGDALTVFYLGERSRGQDHGELISLISRISLEGATVQARRLASILARKTDAEYGSSSPTLKEAESLALQVRRFTSWALEQLPGA
jgi:HEPN domain-containing protein